MGEKKRRSLEKWKKEGSVGVSKQHFIQQLYLTIFKKRSNADGKVLYVRKYFFERF